LDANNVLYSCGRNYYGQLLVVGGGSSLYTPTKVMENILQMAAIGYGSSIMLTKGHVF